MRIATEISIPKEFVIPVDNFSQTQKKQEQKQRHPSHKGTVSTESITLSEEPSEEKNESAMFSFRDLTPEHLEGQVKQANQLVESRGRSLRFFFPVKRKMTEKFLVFRSIPTKNRKRELRVT